MSTLPTITKTQQASGSRSQLTLKAKLWLFPVIIILSVLATAFVFYKPPISNERALAIISARYQGLADLHATRSQLNTLKALTIISSRYQGLADLVAAGEKAAAKRALQVLSERYQSQADSALSGWSPETVRRLRLLSQRYQAQADLFLASGK